MINEDILDLYEQLAYVTRDMIRAGEMTKLEESEHRTCRGRWWF